MRVVVLVVGLVGCGTCPDVRITSPMATPSTPCLSLQATTKRQGGNCNVAFLSGTNGCSEPLVIAQQSSTDPEVTVPPGGTIDVHVVRPDDAIGPDVAYTLSARLGTQDLVIEFQVAAK